MAEVVIAWTNQGECLALIIRNKNLIMKRENGNCEFYRKLPSPLEKTEQLNEGGPGK